MGGIGMNDAVFDRARGIYGSNRVKRGGSWNNNAQYCRSANRNNNSPGNRNNNLGFRLSSSRYGRLRRVQGHVVCAKP